MSSSTPRKFVGSPPCGGQQAGSPFNRNFLIWAMRRKLHACAANRFIPAVRPNPFAPPMPSAARLDRHKNAALAVNDDVDRMAEAAAQRRRASRPRPVRPARAVAHQQQRMRATPVRQVQIVADHDHRLARSRHSVASRCIALTWCARSSALAGSSSSSKRRVLRQQRGDRHALPLAAGQRAHVALRPGAPTSIACQRGMAIA